MQKIKVHKYPARVIPFKVYLYLLKAIETVNYIEQSHRIRRYAAISKAKLEFAILSLTEDFFINVTSDGNIFINQWNLIRKKDVHL